MRVFLIGFMCSGKSHVGRELARASGAEHIDIDRVIERRIGPITPWFQQHGEAAFRAVEAEVLQELLGRSNVVVSTGGGTPCEGDNLERMRAVGTVVFLDVPFDVLLDRIARKGGDRPMLFGLKGEALRERVEHLLSTRLPFYTRADMRVRAEEDPATIAARIQQALEHQER